MKGFTDCLSQELRGTSVGVSCVMPGGVKTNIVKKSRYVASDNAAPTKEEVVELFETMARLSPEEAANEILRGVARGRRRILVGNDARVLAALVQLMPVRYMDLLTWFAERNEQRLRRTRRS